MSIGLGDFPVEITEPIRALDDRKRREIILSLLEKDCRSYSEIQSTVRIKKGTLNHHLSVLVGSGLVQNFSIDDPTSPYSSYYKITSFGQKFLTGIRQALEPRRLEVVTLVDSANPSDVKGTHHDSLIEASASESEEPRLRPLKAIVRR